LRNKEYCDRGCVKQIKGGLEVRVKFIPNSDIKPVWAEVLEVLLDGTKVVMYKPFIGTTIHTRVKPEEILEIEK